MPADIRSFFGGNTSTPIREKEKEVKKDDDSKKKRSKSRKVIEDSDDDEPTPATKKSTPKKAAPKKTVKKESPKGEEVDTADYFASSKPKPIKATSTRTTPTKSKTMTVTNNNAKSSGRKKTATSKKDDRFTVILDEDDSGEDIFAADVKTGGRRKDDGYVEVDSEEEVLPKPKKTMSKAKSAQPSKKEDVEMKDASDDGRDDVVTVIDKPSQKSTSKKRKSIDLESDEEDDDVKPAIKSVKSKSAKPPPAKKARAPKQKEPESAALQAILNDIPTIRAPTPPPKDPNAKIDWKNKGGAGGGGGNSGPPPAAGTKEIPVGQENCLVGMTFVFTGLLETLPREEGQELVKRYGGKVTGAPSSKTNYVVLGSDAGPSKLRKIQDLKLQSIDEDGLFALISRLPANGGDGKAAEKNMEKKKAEAEKIKRDAEAMEREEKRKIAEAEKIEEERQKKAALSGRSAPAPSTVRKVDPSSQLWTSKYAPATMAQICGNKGQVEKIDKWLKGWETAHRFDFQKKGPDGLGGYRAIMIHGPPGIGKTTAAHLAAKLAGYDVLESNASDVRSKKLVESGLTEVLDNTSLLGYYAGDGKNVDKHKKKIVLIMDEVDGMSSGDRGGAGALAKICKKTDIPMILICNDRKLQKMKPFDHVTLDMPFRRPTVEQVRSRIATICHREGLKLPATVIDALIEGSNKDIRQIINMISTAKLDQAALDFDGGKAMSKAWEKHVVLKPWDICHKLLGGGMFSAASKSTLNDKIELYFNDHEFSYLMIQENYLKTKPSSITADMKGRDANLRALQLVDQAAESISDGDLVDRMIHGSQAQWSLMPTHAVFSAVRPASFVAGLSTKTDFTQWLGNNSKTGKLARYVKEIQSHMRLRSSGDRHEIRQQYLPVLWTQMIGRLEKSKDSVEEVIDLMDSYFLTRDDFDYIMELGVGPQEQELVKIETQAKASFTRQYNSRSHPLPFMKASNVVAPAKAVKVMPDLEEAIEEEEDVAEIAEPKDDDDDEIDLKKDKYIRQPKAKKAAPKKAAKKQTVKDEDEDIDSEEDVKPKKGKAKAKPAAKTAAKGKGRK